MSDVHHSIVATARARLTHRLARSLGLGFVFAGLTALYGLQRVQTSDVMQLWCAARAWLDGADPYAVVGPGRPCDWAFPLLYPMTAVLAVLPLTPLPLAVVDPIVVGLGVSLLAWVLMRDTLDDPRLLVFVSGAATHLLQTSQWSALLCAVARAPAFSWLLACKPTLGLALLAAYPSRHAALGMAAFTIVSLLAWLSWPSEWLALLSAGTHLVAPISRPGGLLLLLALWKWRLPEARLLLAWSCMPQTPQLYEAVPLFLIPRTWPEAGVLTAGTYLAGYLSLRQRPFASYTAYMDTVGGAMLWLLYLPCLAMILWRPVHPRPRRAAPAGGDVCGT